MDSVSRKEDRATLGVLAVEDEPAITNVYKRYLERMPQFRMVATAGRGEDAFSILTGQNQLIDPDHIQLMLLDMNLPDSHGLQLVRAMRAHKINTCVIAVTAAHEFSVVRDAIALGVVDYIVKPFSFGLFKDKLNSFAHYYSNLHSRPATATSQQQIDEVVSGKKMHTRSSGAKKSIPDKSREQIVSMLTENGPMVSEDVAKHLDVSRVTARRYLEVLVGENSVLRKPVYGNTGRPRLEFRLAAEDGSQPVQ